MPEAEDTVGKAVGAFCFPESVVNATTVMQYAHSDTARTHTLAGSREAQPRADATAMARVAPMRPPPPPPARPRHVGKTYTFVMTEQSGARMYGYCLRRQPRKAEHARERFPECVCIVSYQYARAPPRGTVAPPYPERSPRTHPSRHRPSLLAAARGSSSSTPFLRP